MTSVLGALGAYLVWRKIRKEVLEWVALLRESKDTLKKLLEEYKKQNGDSS